MRPALCVAAAGQTSIDGANMRHFPTDVAGPSQPGRPDAANHYASARIAMSDPGCRIFGEGLVSPAGFEPATL